MKIFHTADNHLGKTLKKKKALREFAINNFKSIPDKIIESKEKIDYVILAGDVFDKENTDIQCYNAYADTLKRLSNIDTIKKILIITGNHDQFNEYYQNAAIDIIDVIKSDKIVVCNKDSRFYYNEEDDLLIMLLPYNRELFLTNEAGGKIIVDRINELIVDLFNKPEYSNSYKVLVSHFAIEEWMPFSNETISKSELTAGNHFNLVLLGDLHNETYEDLDLDTPIIYSGSTMHTSISDLYNHDNVAKIITIENNQIDSIELVKFDKPKIVLLDKTNIESVKNELNEKTIVITSDLDIHTSLKDRVLHSMYKPNIKSNKDVMETINDTVDMESLDIDQLAKDKISQDTTLNDETKDFLYTLLDIDTDSHTNKEISDMISNVALKDLVV